MNLERRGWPLERAVAAPKLIELVPAGPLALADAPYVVRVGGVELEVGTNFDEWSLRRLIGLLKSC